MRFATTHTAAFLILVGGLACLDRPATAQTPNRAVAPATVVTSIDSPDAERTRDELNQLLEKYPPSLGRVMKLDPSLLTSEAYLQTYPTLKAFLAQHPEVSRNPAYFFERVQVNNGGNYREDPQTQAYRMWEDVMSGVAGFAVALLVLSSLAWIVRSLIDYRRWSRLSKVQSEAHNKLLDRMTANEELLAYVQSPAGAKFLQSAPISLEPGARAIGAPFSRILWSVQAGLVLAAGGLGLMYVSGRVINEAAQPLYAMGVLAVALGLGFVVSSGVAYALSRKLGLFDGLNGTSAEGKH